MSTVGAWVVEGRDPETGKDTRWTFRFEGPGEAARVTKELALAKARRIVETGHAARIYPIGDTHADP